MNGDIQGEKWHLLGSISGAQVGYRREERAGAINKYNLWKNAENFHFLITLNPHAYLLFPNYAPIKADSSPT